MKDKVGINRKKHISKNGDLKKIVFQGHLKGSVFVCIRCFTWKTTEKTPEFVCLLQ